NVNPWLADVREVKLRILVTHPSSPRPNFAAKSFSIISVCAEPQYSRGLLWRIQRIEFDDLDLVARRCVSDLVVGDDRRTRPSRYRVGPDVPYQSVLCAICRDERAHNEPSVLRFGATVEQHERSAIGGDAHAGCWIFRRK